MEFTTFVRKPFSVEAVEITEANIEEVAELIGVLSHKDNGVPYIEADRRSVQQEKVYLGFWMTRKGSDIRCYSPRVFREQFTESTPDIQTWVDFMNGPQGMAANG